MDCSTNPPNIVKRTITIPPGNCNELMFVKDVCFVTYQDKDLLVNTDKHGGISAYNTDVERVEWYVKGALGDMKHPLYPAGVTTGGFEHLFVCDTNNRCVQCFSATDGKYLGHVIRYDDRNLGSPMRIRWCEDTASLVVVTSDDSGWYVDVWKLA